MIAHQGELECLSLGLVFRHQARQEVDIDLRVRGGCREDQTENSRDHFA
jgi:hypothetical protein